jgi:hypothetical protein
MTIQQARDAVGVEETDAYSTWVWYAVGVNDENGELAIYTQVGPSSGFPSDGIRRAAVVYYTHGKNGISLRRELCQ